jgi:hypothetical protein
VNLTTGETLIEKSTNLEPGAEQPMVDGFKLVLYNAPQVSIDSVNTLWNDEMIHPPQVIPFRYSKTNGIAVASDYRIDFGEVGVDTSKEIKVSKSKVIPSMPVNFTVTNTGTGEMVPFGFWEKDVVEGDEGKFTAFTDPKRARSDQIILLEDGESEEAPWIFTWNVQIDLALHDSLKRNAEPGDSLTIRTIKPFLSNDVYEFTTFGQRADAELAKEQMDQIKVVPNPYVVSNSWEPLNPYTNGRGPRELHFIHLPEECTIKIFNVRGQ